MQCGVQETWCRRCGAGQETWRKLQEMQHGCCRRHGIAGYGDAAGDATDKLAMLICIVINDKLGSTSAYNDQLVNFALMT